MVIGQTQQVAQSKATTWQKVAAGSRNTGLKAIVSAIAIVLGVVFVVGFAYIKFGSRSVEADTATPAREAYSGEKLSSKVPMDMRPNMDAAKEKSEKPNPTTKTETRQEEREREEPKGLQWEYFRSRTDGSPIAVTASLEEGTKSVVPGLTKPSMRHVPRGTLLPAFLESKVLSDNLDSRVRATLLEDYKLGGDVILPAGGQFIGNASSLGSRYQQRIAVKVTNYIYPDKEREIAIDGVLLNQDESAHLLADDKKFHTGKLILGTTALALLGAASGYGGAASGDGFAMLAGSRVADGFSELGEKNVEHLTEILPTLIVEPGKPVWVFVDESLDVPQYDMLPVGFSVPSTRLSDAQGVPGQMADVAKLQERLEAAMGQMQRSEEMMESLQKSGPLAMPGSGGLPLPGGGSAR